MRPSVIISYAILTVSTLLLLSCAALQFLRPLLTDVGKILIEDLNQLVTQYETASLPEDPTDSQIALFSTSQEALYALLIIQLDLCYAEISEEHLQHFVDRIAAVHSREP